MGQVMIEVEKEIMSPTSKVNFTDIQSSAKPEPFGAKAPGPKFDPEQM